MTEPRTIPRKTRAPLRAFLIAFVVLVTGLLIRIRTCNVVTASADAVWHQNELYIFVEQNKLAWSQNLWSSLWSLAKGTLLIPTSPDFHRIDCIVYRVTNTTAEEHLAKGWHIAGSIAPYKGMPHAFIGGESDARGVYRWTGKDFVRLTPSETEAAESGYTYTEELFKREGWSRADVLPVRGSRDYTIVLEGKHFILRAMQTINETTSNVTETSKIELIKDDDPKSMQVLYDLKDKSGFLSPEEYKRFVE
jgi:hypothetical protein